MRSSNCLTLALSCALALAIAGAAFAQTTVPATPTITPAPNCNKPGAPPQGNPSELGKAAAEAKRNNWMRDMKAYLDCVKAFITEQQSQASSHAAAANGAVEEYNKSIKTLNEQIEAAKQ
jgi:hypothetical protein